MKKRIERICIKDYIGDDFIYIGRPSKYGNPYSSKDKNIAEFTVSTRIESIRLHKEFILKNISIIDSLIDELHKNEYTKIGCFCKTTDRCHGDTLIELIHERLSKSIF